jgi:hypothetical protein
MGRTLAEARKIVSELSLEDREILSGELVYEVRKADPEIEKAWTIEAEKRAQEIIDGKAELADGETVMERMRLKVHGKV